MRFYGEVQNVAYLRGCGFTRCLQRSEGISKEPHDGMGWDHVAGGLHPSKRGLPLEAIFFRRRPKKRRQGWHRLQRCGPVTCQQATCACKCNVSFAHTSMPKSFRRVGSPCDPERLDHLIVGGAPRKRFALDGHGADNKDVGGHHQEGL